MKNYCNRCHRLYDDIDVCPNCKKPLQKGVKPSTPVAVVSASGFERVIITAALSDENIPFASRAEKKEISADAVTGIDNAKYRIEVPYSYYGKAIDVLVGINAINPAKEDLEAADEATEQNEDEFEDMSPRKRMFVRIISIILLILVVALVIMGVDAVTAIIKDLFV